MRRVLLMIMLVAGAAACGDNAKPPKGGEDAPPTPPIDAGVDAPDGPAVVSCALDRPGELARPPAGVLPCELLPPGFAP
jgi:hypothetical protein